MGMDLMIIKFGVFYTEKLIYDTRIRFIRQLEIPALGN